MSSEEKPNVKEPLATFNERLMAGLIDYGIVYGVYIVAIILTIIIGFIPYVPVLNLILWLITVVLYFAGVIAAIYVFIWMPYKKDGQTFGKKKQNIKVMVVEDEAKWKLRAIQEGDLTVCIIRGIIGSIEATVIPVLLPWLMITNDNNNQRLADQVAKTVVVQVDEEGQVLEKPRQ